MNRRGCTPRCDVCLAHDEPLICRHGCSQATAHECKDRESPADTLTRVAPVQGEWGKRPAGTVPWDVYLRAFETYHRAFSAQTAERIAERGGFGYREMQCLLAGHYGFGCKDEHAPVPGWVAKQ